MFLDGGAQQRVEAPGGRIEIAGDGAAERQGPIRLGSHLAIAPLQPVSRSQLFDAVDQGPRTGHIVERKVAVESVETQVPGDFGMNQNGLKLGAEEEIAARAREIERLDAHAVAGQDEPALGLAPQGYREHAAQAGETAGVPFEKSGENGLRVGAGTKAVAAPLQLCAQFGVIVDFAIEGDYGAAIG